jgi:hypothetical protein
VEFGLARLPWLLQEQIFRRKFLKLVSAVGVDGVYQNILSLLPRLFLYL